MIQQDSLIENIKESLAFCTDANLPDLAEMTVRHILKEENVDLSKLNLHMTYAMHPSKVITL